MGAYMAFTKMRQLIAALSTLTGGAEAKDGEDRVRELLSVAKIVSEDVQHEEGCRWWDANISELNSPESRAANDAKCNCVVGQARAALAKFDTALQPEQGA
jgi:hypothetical protein